MLIDPFGRHIRYLRISITDRCNLRCVYCMPAEGVPWIPRQEILTFEEIVEVVRVSAGLGINAFRLTGGEPLLRAGLEDLVGMIAEIDGVDDLSMTTNGVLLPRHAHRLAAAGLGRVNISLDTLRPERFRDIARMGSAEEVEAGIDAALDAGLDPVKLNVVVVRGVNDDEILELGRLAAERPLHVRFIELMPLGDYFRKERLVSAEEILERLAPLGGLTPAEGCAGCGPARSYTFPGAVGSIGVIGAVTRAFCSTCNRLRLTATGKLRPCLDDEAALDLLPGLRPVPDADELERRIRLTVGRRIEQHSMTGRDEGSARYCMSAIGG